MSEPDVPWSDAAAELVNAIADDLKLSDMALQVLVEARDGPENRKRLILGLKLLDLITVDQAAFAIAYRWPLRGA